jgi:uncharacterized CHY-type Zn-finger protein
MEIIRKHATKLNKSAKEGFIERMVSLIKAHGLKCTNIKAFLSSRDYGMAVNEILSGCLKDQKRVFYVQLEPTELGLYLFDKFRGGNVIFFFRDEFIALFDYNEKVSFRVLNKWLCKLRYQEIGEREFCNICIEKVMTSVAICSTCGETLCELCYGKVISCPFCRSPWKNK